MNSKSAKSNLTTSGSPGHVLREVLLEKIEQNPAFSLRALARRLGVSHAYLSQVMNGKKTLSAKRAVEFGQILGLDETFVAAAIKEKKNRETGQAYFLEIERFKLLTQWYHIAILDLTTVKGFRSDAKWIARKLGITIVQTKAALERLDRLGLLTMQNGEWVKVADKITFGDDAPKRAVREFHCQMIRKALELHETATDAGFDRRDISGTTMAINPRLIPEAKKKIAKFRRELTKFLQQGDCDALYQLNIQVFSLEKDV